MSLRGLDQGIPSDPLRHGSSWSLRSPEAGRLATTHLNLEKTMKVRLLLTLAGLISFAVPASIAQDAMKVVTPDELDWKDETVLPKGAQTAVLIGDPSKAETIVLRVKFPSHYKVPPHSHTFSEVITVLSGTCWNGMGDDIEKGVMLKPRSVFVLPSNHAHQIWTTDEEAIIQVQFTGPGDITYINPADDPRNKAQ
jgi:quercetin dioxygenase-like cupin family protein